MGQPTDPENIQLIAVLRVVGLSQDDMASVLHLAKVTIVKTEKWLRTVDFEKVWDILDDNVLKATVVRELPSFEEVDNSILVKAPQVDRASILAHYGRKAPEKDSEEDTKRHRDDLGWSQKIHLDTLAESAQKLRSRIINPDIRKRPFTEEKSLWDWNNFNWRLAPSYWFLMVVPLLDEVFISAWILNWENLLSHLADSRLKKHYDELEKSTDELQSKLNEFVAKLKSTDSRWWNEWGKFIDYLGTSFVDGRGFQPDVITQKKTIDEIADSLPVSNKFIEDTAKRFKEYYPNLDKHCDQLENLLQQVYDDLDSGTVSKEIEASKCSECP